MAKKLVDMEEAAKMVGVSPEMLNEMRERREIYGYRDGGSWKFKQEDVEKLLADRASSENEGEYSELDEDPDSILLSELELGQSSDASSSTIIGGKSRRKSSGDSDIKLAEPNDELTLDVDKHDSDLDLDAALSDSSKGASKGGSGVSPMFDEMDTLDLDMPSAADSGVLSSGAKGSGSGLELADSGLLGGQPSAGGSNLSLGGDDVLALGEAPGSGLSGGSAIELSEDLDDDLVLGGSSHGDLSRTGDSGISLLDPADSGISLESAPLELGGSAAESLELGEDDLLTDQPAPKRKAAAVSADEESDDDFLLTPLDEGAVEESSDSGSQVIALEGDVEFDEAAVSDLGGFDSEGGGVDLGDDLGADFGSALSADDSLSPAAGAGALAAAGAGAVTVPVREPAYSGWNVASLVMCAMLLMFSGMFMFDLLRNMWSWNGPYKANSFMMDIVMRMFDK